MILCVHAPDSRALLAGVVRLFAGIRVCGVVISELSGS